MRDSWTGLRIVHEEGGRVTVTFPEGPTGVGSSTEEAISLAQKATPTEAKEKGGEKK